MNQPFRRRFAAVGLVGAILAVPLAGAEDAVTVVVRQPGPAAPETAELPGSFEPYEEALLHAKVTGYVSDVHVDIGQRVAVGTALVRLDIPEMEPGLGRARADVVAAQAALEQAEARTRRDRITHERLSRLQSQEPLAVTQQDVDMAAADLQVADAAVRSAEAEIAVARAKLAELEALTSYAVIRAPFDGLVARRFVDPGALVVSGADGGDPVLEVVRDDRLRLVLALPEALATRVVPGQPVRVTVDALPGRTFEAVVSRCAGLLSSDTRTMRAEIDMESEQGLLRPGMYASVRLEFDGDSGELSVPASVVRRDGDGQPFVWAVRDGTVAKTLVEIARDDGAFAVIGSGLRPETAVVVEGPAELHEGQAVRIVAGAEERP